MEDTTIEENMQIEVEQPITVSLVKFNPLVSEIETYKEYKNLKIAGVDDREGFKKVHDARMQVRALRLEIQKQEKSAIGSAKTALKDYISTTEGKAKGYYDDLEPIETHLDKEETDYENEKERVRQEKLAAEQLRVQKRITSLLDSDFSYDGRFYSAGRERATDLDIRSMDEDQFELFFSNGKRELVRIEAEEAEKDRIAAEKQAELDRIEAERKAAEQKLIDEAKAEIARQQQEIENTKKEWARLKEEAANEAKKAREAQMTEQAKIDAANKETALKLAAEQKKLQEEKDELARQEKIKKDKEKKEADEKIAAAKSEQDKKDRAAKELKDKEAKDKKAIEDAAKELALMPDKEKLKAFAESIVKIPLPELASEEANAILVDVYKRLKETSHYIMTCITII